MDESASTSASLPLNRQANEINPADSMDVQTNNVSNTSIDDSASINITSTVSPLLKKKTVQSPLVHLQLPYQKRYAGRPRTAKASHFASYQKAPKSFLAKNPSERNKSNFCLLF